MAEARLRLRVPDRPARRRAWATGLAALFPLLSLVTDFGIGLCGLLFLATALCWWRDAWPAWKAAWPRLRWVALAFLLDLGWMACLMLGRLHDANAIDRPLRMCLMMAAVPVVLVARPPSRALWLGAAAGALASLALVAAQRLWLGVARPGGWMNPITFGDLALCLALLSLAGALAATRARTRWGAACGVLAGLAASLLTGSRGGWLMLALIPLLLFLPLLSHLPHLLRWRRWRRWRGLPTPRPAPLRTPTAWPRPSSSPAGRLVPHAHAQARSHAGAHVHTQARGQAQGRALSLRLALVLPGLAIALAALAYALPQTGVRDRIAIGVSDVRLYLAGNRAPTSLSVRLELWRGGWMLVREHPWTGLDTPEYKRRMRTWVAEGKLNPAVFAPPEPPHLHNDTLQVLVTRGAIGLAAWIGILLAPLGFFWTRLRQARMRAGAGRARGPGRVADPAAPAAASFLAPSAASAEALADTWAAALAGLLLVLAYAGFGLTEVIFWSMKANVFYALTLFLLIGWVLAAEIEPGPEASRGMEGRIPSDARSDAGSGVDHDTGCNGIPATGPDTGRDTGRAVKVFPPAQGNQSADEAARARAAVQRSMPNLRRNGRACWSRFSASGNGPRWPRTPSRIARSRMRRAPR